MDFKLVICLNDIQLMVDQQRRKKLALNSRHLSTGLVSNDEFEEKIMDDITYSRLPEQYHRAKEQALAACQKLGAYEVWLFFTRHDYESASGKHLFLQQKDQY